MLAATSFSIDADVVIRLLSAAALGAAIGVEREVSDQPAGLRTHIAVALGAALFGVLSTLGFQEFDRPRAESTIQADVTRIASNVVVGIGFLGAGVIFRHGGTVRNLTTAASLWVVAAIGLAAGVGNPMAGAIATVVLLVSLVILRPLREFIRRQWATRSMMVEVHLVPGTDPEPLLQDAGELGLEMPDLMIGKERGHVVMRTTVVGHPDTISRWMARLAGSDTVETVNEA